MSTWEEMFANKLFISDLGVSQTALVNGEDIEVGQFAVWSPTQDGKQHQIIEVGDDVDVLMEKYSIKPEYVCTLA